MRESEFNRSTEWTSIKLEFVWAEKQCFVWVDVCVWADGRRIFFSLLVLFYCGLYDENVCEYAFGWVSFAKLALPLLPDTSISIVADLLFLFFFLFVYIIVSEWLLIFSATARSCTCEQWAQSMHCTIVYTYARYIDAWHGNEDTKITSRNIRCGTFGSWLRWANCVCGVWFDTRQ